MSIIIGQQSLILMGTLGVGGLLTPSEGSPTEVLIAGSGSFIVPTYNNLIVELWGAGGRTDTIASYTAGADGTNTVFNTSLIAEGGQGGQGSYYTSAGGSYSGGDSGENGVNGTVSPKVTSYGPPGVGGPAGNATANSGYGQGQSGSRVDVGGKNPQHWYKAGAAGGGYVIKEYNIGDLTPGDSIPYTVGSGAENGRMLITWT